MLNEAPTTDLCNKKGPTKNINGAWWVDWTTMHRLYTALARLASGRATNPFQIGVTVLSSRSQWSAELLGVDVNTV